MINNIIIYALKSSILFSFNIILVMVVQGTVFARHNRYAKALWIISIIHAFLPYGLFNFQLKRKQAYQISHSVRESTETHSNLFLVIAIIWLIGVAVVIAREVKAHYVIKDMFQRALYLPEEKIYLSGDVESAFTYGIFRPRILVSYMLDLDTMDLVLRHEREHIRHGDNFLKLCYMIVLAVNWFNPLAWIGKAHLDRLLELCCDGYAVEDFPEERQKEYMKCLVEQAVGDDNGSMTTCGFLFRKSELYCRVCNIFNMRIVSVLRDILVNLAMIACVLALSTGIQQGVNHIKIIYVGDEENWQAGDNLIYPHGISDLPDDVDYIYEINYYGEDGATQIFYDDRGRSTAIFTNEQ